MARLSAHTAALAVVLASTFVQSAEARSCYYDRFGRQRCTGLLGGTIGGIIVACVIPVLFALLLLCFCVRRRRRSKITNESYITPAQQNPQMYQQQTPAPYYPPYGGEQQQSYGQPQYGGEQQQSYGQPQYGAEQQQYGYGNRTDGGEGGYAPPPGPPPAPDYTAPPSGTPPPAESMYPAPPGPPPAAHHSGGKATAGESAAYYNRA